LSKGKTRRKVMVTWESLLSTELRAFPALKTPTGPAALLFTIEAEQPSSGISSGGEMFMAKPYGTTGADGKFRTCDLAPAAYRLSADEPDPHGIQLFGVTGITISDRDVENVETRRDAGTSARRRGGLGRLPAE
jgi:hypothetical protein